MFQLAIELVNDAMQTHLDVADALREVMINLRENGPVKFIDRGIVKDTNGNTVGTWRFQP